MQTVLLTGGTGLVGKALTRQLLAKGYKVIILSRSSQLKTDEKVTYACWDLEKMEIDRSAIADADYIIHLAGANVGEKRWTRKRKQEIADSRIKSGRLLYDALKGTRHQVKKIISASGIGWYGADPLVPNPNPFTEDAPAATDFLGATCYKWEQSLSAVKNMGIGLVMLRTGIVLSKSGGALKEFLKPLKLGLAIVFGTGRQVVSWIHIDDLVHLYIDAMEKDGYTGIYNAVAPEPVSNRNLMYEIAKATCGKYFSMFHIPSVLIQIIFGEMGTEVLKSATVSSSKIQKEGFVFLYPSIRSAMRHIAGAPL